MGRRSLAEGADPPDARWMYRERENGSAGEQVPNAIEMGRGLFSDAKTDWCGFCDEIEGCCGFNTPTVAWIFDSKMAMRSIRLSVLRLVLPTIIGLVLLGLPNAGHAQAPLGEGRGTVTLEGWPRSLPTLLDEMGRRAPYLLPRIDSLALDYRYAVTDTTSRWSFVLSWRPAERVLYEGEVMPLRKGPQGIHMTNVELRATVQIDGEKRAEMIVAVDSMALRPTPNRFAFNVTVDHNRVFLDTPPTEARRILSEGASLDRLVVERMGFSASGAQRDGRSDREPDARRPRDEPSRRPRIYRPQTRIFIGWRVAPRPYYVDGRDEDGDRKTRRPRGNTIGRSPSADTDRSSNTDRGDERKRSEEDGQSEEKEGEEETGRSGIGKVLSGEDDEDEDDEDDTDLQMPALAAAAAVGLVAFAGGTVGLYGQSDTPIGLTSGYTHPKGGIQLQAAINRAVLEDRTDQKLSVRALGFYDVFESRLQPAVGLGVRINPDRGRDWEPAVSGGLVGNLGQFVLYGGVDVVQLTPEIGIAYNFRYGRGEDN